MNNKKKHIYIINKKEKEKRLINTNSEREKRRPNRPDVTSSRTTSPFFFSFFFYESTSPTCYPTIGQSQVPSLRVIKVYPYLISFSCCIFLRTKPFNQIFYDRFTHSDLYILFHPLCLVYVKSVFCVYWRFCIYLFINSYVHVTRMT